MKSSSQIRGIFLMNRMVVIEDEITWMAAPLEIASLNVREIAMAEQRHREIENGGRRNTLRCSWKENKFSCVTFAKCIMMCIQWNCDKVCWNSEQHFITWSHKTFLKTIWCVWVSVFFNFTFQMVYQFKWKRKLISF